MRFGISAIEKCDVWTKFGTDGKFPFLSRENKMRQTPPASPVPPKIPLDNKLPFIHIYDR
jgi:hypothetical protein